MSFIKNMKPQAGSKYKQGYYFPVNPLKYIGDDKRVIYRSSLEHLFCVQCDTDPNIIRWISEPDFLQIRYINPFKKRMATYYPDFYVQFQSAKASGVVQAVIEIKADNMINLPKHANPARMSNYMKKSFILNQAKKKAAEIVCAEKGMVYLVLTEKSDFFKKKKNG